MAASQYKYRRLESQPENPFAAFIPTQKLAVIPQFTLESGFELRNVPVAYKTYGTLSPQGDNAMVICHALTGSADVSDWWGPLLGPEKAFDTLRFYVVCLNSLGSPYGSASPVTATDGDTSQGLYGPEFPLTTVRDDVNIFKLVLEDLGVRQIAAVIGGSMGGMLVLEFAYFGRDYVRTIIPMATSARYSAWGISWGEAQRQSIYSDPKYDDGYYSFDDPPSAGLGAARMSALLTYRSRDSFESRFGRNIPDPSRRQNINGTSRPETPSQEHWAIHNDGHQNAGSPRPSRKNSNTGLNGPSPTTAPTTTSPTTATSITPPNKKCTPTYFSAQSYLRYQGAKFIKRFDANCYIAITRKLDTHDVSRNRTPDLASALALITQPTLILGIRSDGLFTFAEQQELAASIPDSILETIDSPDGHDAFLLEFEQVNAHIARFLKDKLPDITLAPPQTQTGDGGSNGGGTAGDNDAEVEDGESLGVTKSSTFGEAEVDDITAW